MVHYLQEVQGSKYVVGRNFVYIAATPEARRLFLSTSKHLLLQACPCNEDATLLHWLPSTESKGFVLPMPTVRAYALKLSDCPV